jgi:hypothetical protein
MPQTHFAGHADPNHENDARASEDFDYGLVDELLEGVDEEAASNARSPERSPRAEFCTQMLIFIKDDQRSRVALDSMFVIFGKATLADVGRTYTMSVEAIRKRLVRFRSLIGDSLIRMLDDEDVTFILRMLRYIRYSHRARLTVDCIFIAMNGEQIGGVPMHEIGRQHGLTTAMISKRVQQVQADLYLPPCRYNKSSRAKESYAKYNRRPCRAPSS